MILGLGLMLAILLTRVTFKYLVVRVDYLFSLIVTTLRVSQRTVDSFSYYAKYFEAPGQEQAGFNRSKIFFRRRQQYTG